MVRFRQQEKAAARAFSRDAGAGSPENANKPCSRLGKGFAALFSGSLLIALSSVTADAASPSHRHGLVQHAAVDTTLSEEDLTAPPVIDPKSVETQTLGPATHSDFKPSESTLAPLPILILSGEATWDDAYDKLVAAFRTLDEESERLGLKRAGEQITVYLTSDDRGFEFEAQLPFSGVTTEKPGKNVRLGASHAGKVFVFPHTGSFADMDNTYELIANYLDEKNVEANDLYMERYRSDLVTSRPDALEIEVLVPAP